MKKRIFVGLFAIVLCFILAGCGEKKEEKTTAENWKLNVSGKNTMFTEEIDTIFQNAKKEYDGEELKPFALLGEQVVAGTNYMFLCRAENEFKIAIVYKDLTGKSQITSVTNFDVKKYVNKKSELSKETLVGGWNTNILNESYMLEDKIQNAFDKAIEKQVGITYYPIEVLAEQEGAGTNYAVLCYGKLSDDNETTGVFVLNLHVDEKNNSEIVSATAIDLKEYNK